MKSGLKNLGNTCFMNAALQCLIHSPEFLIELLKLPLCEKKNEYPMTYGMCKLIAKMSTEQGNPVNPSDIRHLISKSFSYIADGSQHDSHEFFLLLLQLLEEEQNKTLGGKKGSFPTDIRLPPSSFDVAFSDSYCIQLIQVKAKEWWKTYKEHNPNVITNVFYGEQVSSIRCTNCHHQSCVLSAFNSLYLSIPKKQYQLTVNVVIQYLIQTSSYDNPVGFNVISIRCTFDDNSTLKQLEDQILSKISSHSDMAKETVIFLQGKFEKNSGSILYTYLNKHTLASSLQNLPPKTTIIAYYIPYEISREDYHSFILVNQVSLLYMESCNLFHLNNACIPFCMLVHPNETSASLFTRIRYLLRTLYTLTENKDTLSEVSQAVTIPVNVELLQKSLFYSTSCMIDSNEYETDSYCFPYIRVLGNNTVSIRSFENLPRLNLSTCSIVGHNQVMAIDLLDSFSSLIDSYSNRTAFSLSSVFRISRLAKVPDELGKAVRSYFDETHSDQLMTKIANEFRYELKLLRYELCYDRRIELQDCFGFSSIAEMAVPCENCHLQCKQEIQQRLTELPPVLVIVLKRFDYNIHSSYGIHSFASQNKVSDYVDFPLEGLDLSSYVLNSIPAVYDLICVCNHSGSSFFGHYYAYCRTVVGEGTQWMEFNDSSTSVISPSVIPTSNAYLLFYHRRDLPLPYQSEQAYRDLIKQGLPELSDVCDGMSVLRRSSMHLKEVFQSSSRKGSKCADPENGSPNPVVEKDAVCDTTHDYQAALALEIQLRQEDQRKDTSRYHTCIITLIVVIIIILSILAFSLLLYYRTYK